MARTFDDMLARSGAAVNRLYGEDFEYRPFLAADPNARALPDPDRAVKTITAVYGDSHARAAGGPARRPAAEDDRGAHASSRPTAEFDLAQLPYEIASGDRMLRLKDGQWYRIAEPRHDGFGRVIVDLNCVTPPPALQALDFSRSSNSGYVAPLEDI